MPEICRFDGISVVIFWDDHNPPHFHAQYAEFTIEIEITTLGVRQGRLPPRQRRRLFRWAREHQSELMDAWEKVSAGETPEKIAPPSR